jgi:hypothetical protein
VHVVGVEVGLNTKRNSASKPTLVDTVVHVEDHCASYAFCGMVTTIPT